LLARGPHVQHFHSVLLNESLQLLSGRLVADADMRVGFLVLTNKLFCAHQKGPNFPSYPRCYRSSGYGETDPGAKDRTGKHFEVGREDSTRKVCCRRGKALFQLTKEKGMEGIIAKRKDSVYRPGKRTSDWLKIKARLQQEFVVGGFTAPKGSRKHLGAIVLGAYTKGKLRHYGYAGSGFTEKGLKDAVDRMKPLFTNKCPFVNPPNIKEKIQWVRSKLVCEVEYAELTADDQLRQTTFLGWREDKKAQEVVLER
jgi:ATP-dependent DNA ligase